MISKSYDQENKVLKIVRSGQISLNNLLDLCNDIGENYKVVSDLNILEDIRFSETKFTIVDFPVLAEHLSQCMLGFEHVRHAQLVEEPKSTALSMFYEEETSKLIENYCFKTFSTEEAAYRWLKR